MGEGFASNTKRREVNPTGYYEDNELTSMNHGVLYAAGGHFKRLPTIERLREAAVETSLDPNIALYIERRSALYAGIDWGWKDPRVVPLWEFYRPRITEALDPRIIFTHRSTTAIARSLQRYQGVNDISLAMTIAGGYERGIKDIAASVHCPCLHLAFEDWWRVPDEQREALDAFVGRSLDYAHFDAELWRVERDVAKR